MIGRRRFLAGLSSGLLPLPAAAQGFAGLAGDAGGFAVPTPDPSFRFPRDHGPHPDYRIEWWYLTANLRGADGARYGVQWTLFRSALRPGEEAGWGSPQVWFAHAAATGAEAHLSAERYARGGIGQAGVTHAPFAAWINDWSMTTHADPEADAIDRLALDARGDGFAYDLTLDAGGAPLLFHGGDGYSVKSAHGQASYYYSQPHYRVRGALSLNGRDIAVTGQAWLDREWTSQLLRESQSGWDWIALHLDGGRKLMVGRVRDSAGPEEIIGTFVGGTGAPHYLSGDAVTLTPGSEVRVAGRTLPVEWRIEVPRIGVDVVTTPLNPRSWMETTIDYWEGPVFATGSHDGEGYLEMTGYE